METKQHILTALSEIFTCWQELLASLGVEQINVPLAPSDWTVKDVVAHLWFWQEASIARMEAALNNTEPKYPEWWELFGSDPEEDVDRTNAWNYERNRDKPWLKVYADWKAQFKHYLELAQQVTEGDLLETGRYAWMGGYALSASSKGTLEHHQEHYADLSAWLQEHGKLNRGRVNG
jgi:hypothetical protein